MIGTYANCQNLTTAVCGPNVKQMYSVYSGCTNLTTAVCGPNVTNMYSTYNGCTNLTTAVCGPNVTEMYSTYYDCTNLTTAVCGDNVRAMASTYYNCINLTTAVCGPNVTRMDYTYQNCTNLTTAACGSSVTDMSGAYMNCTNLTTAVCGPNVTNMCDAYINCSNLTTAVCGPSVTNTTNAYTNCTKLTNVTIHNGVNSIGANTFSNCTNLTEISIPQSVTSIQQNAFSNCTNLRKVDFTQYKTSTALPTVHNSAFNGAFSAEVLANTKNLFIIPASLYKSWNDSSFWKKYENNISVDNSKAVVYQDEDNYMKEFNNTFELQFKVINLSDNATINATSSLDTVVTASTTFTKSNDFMHILTVQVKTLAVEGTANVTVTVTEGDFTYTKEIAIQVFEQLPFSYTVEPVSGATYGFELNSAGYYESKNKGKHNSYAICKVNIVNSVGKKVYFDCINYGEKRYDYGMLSNINTELSKSNSADTSSKLKIGFKYSNSSSVQTVEYGVVEGYVYVKYIKDNSGSNGNDTLQFKVRFED